MSVTRIAVTHVGTYSSNSGLGVVIRRDLKRDGWAFVAAPPQFVADADQLRYVADAMHDMADKLERK